MTGYQQQESVCNNVQQQQPQPVSGSIHGAAIIVAAGSGARFGNADKAFVELRGRPMAVWSLDVFEQSTTVDEIVLVVGDHTLAAGNSLLESAHWPKLKQVVNGGARRQDSVVRGFLAVSPEASTIAIHDAARPLVTGRLVDDVMVRAAQHGAALAAIPVSDTLKRTSATGRVLETLSREHVWKAQTPQAFRRDWLERAVDVASHSLETFTDESAIIERLGYAVTVVPGSADNLKVTLPEDLDLAEFALQRRHGNS